MICQSDHSYLHWHVALSAWRLCPCGQKQVWELPSFRHPYSQVFVWFIQADSPSPAGREHYPKHQLSLDEHFICNWSFTTNTPCLLIFSTVSLSPRGSFPGPSCSDWFSLTIRDQIKAFLTWTHITTRGNLGEQFWLSGSRVKPWWREHT